MTRAAARHRFLHNNWRDYTVDRAILNHSSGCRCAIQSAVAALDQTGNRLNAVREILKKTAKNCIVRTIRIQLKNRPCSHTNRISPAERSRAVKDSIVGLHETALRISAIAIGSSEPPKDGKSGSIWFQFEGRSRRSEEHTS